MEDDPERGPAAGVDGRDAVAHRAAVVAARAGHGTLARGEQQERALLEGDDMGARLRPGPLLEQDELAAAEVHARTVEHRDRLEREGDVAVDVLVQGVVPARAVAE